MKNKFILKAKIIEDLITIPEGLSEDEKKDIEALNEGQLHANEKTAKELADLVIYSKASKLKNFESSKKYSSYDKIASINSPKARFRTFGQKLNILIFWTKKSKTSKKCEEFAKSKGNEFVKHTNFQLIRIYPHAVNQLSQNYDPIMPWANGCQVGNVYFTAWSLKGIHDVVYWRVYSVGR